MLVPKPAGWAASVSDPNAGLGLLEWLRQREARWNGLLAPWKLPAEEGGLMALAKTRSAAERLAERRPLERADDGALQLPPPLGGFAKAQEEVCCAFYN